MKILKNAAACAVSLSALSASGAMETPEPATNTTAVLSPIVVEATAISKYRPETVNGGTFTDMPPEKLPCVVDALTEDFIREHNPTDLHDLLRYVPGIESGGKSLLIRQPGTFTIRGKGGATPMLDGVLPVGSGAGLFMDPFLMERIEVVKGPIGSLNGGGGAVQNASGGGGSVNLYVKSAKLDKDEINLQENTSAGRRTQRHRGMADVNETFLDGKAAVRVVGTADYYEPAYIHEGSQKGARPRESFSIAPSFIFEPNDNVRFGLKTMFQQVDQPSYIGVPVWRGRPGGGYSWYESSCRRGDRSKIESFLVNPWLDWQANDNWLLKFGASLMVNSWEQTTREPYSSYMAGSPPVYTAEFLNYCATGMWNPGNKYSTGTGFGKSHQLNRNYSLYVRSIYDRDLWKDVVKNSFVVQPDYYYRESNGGFVVHCSRRRQVRPVRAGGVHFRDFQIPPHFRRCRISARRTFSAAARLAGILRQHFADAYAHAGVEVRRRFGSAGSLALHAVRRGRPPPHRREAVAVGFRLQNRAGEHAAGGQFRFDNRL